MSVCFSILHPAFSGSHGHPPFHPTALRVGVHPHDVVLCHWVFGRSQDHSGALMAEEFKACLISLGYDVENDKQVGAPREGDAVCQAHEQENNAELPAVPVRLITTSLKLDLKLSEFFAYLAKIQLVKLH